MSEKYILVGHDPVPCNDLLEWARWFETAERQVARDFFDDLNVTISTVFLGVDHRFGGGSPLLFETMIFGGPHDQYQERCTFWDDALKQHRIAVELAKGSKP